MIRQWILENGSSGGWVSVAVLVMVVIFFIGLYARLATAASRQWAQDQALKPLEDDNSFMQKQRG